MSLLKSEIDKTRDSQRLIDNNNIKRPIIVMWYVYLVIALRAVKILRVKLASRLIDFVFPFRLVFLPDADTCRQFLLTSVED